MKKLIIAVLSGAAMTLSMTAQAAPAEITVDPITTTDCELLASGVKVNLSANVSGAYECDLETNAIQIATCHAAGSRSARDVTCRVVGQDAEGADVYNHADCTGVADETITDVIGFRAYVAASSGGGVAEAALDGACNAGNLQNLTFFAN
ncbi:MAG: hypothetical protein R6X15_03125 [Pseudomonadota bacterium]